MRTRLPTLFLKPGEMYFAEDPTLVSTLLGSCVSIIMFNRRTRVGAICHSLLPAHKGRAPSCKGDCREGFRYVECSIRRMIEVFEQRNIIRSEIEVKVFGGADMFGSLDGRGKNPTVGAQNIKMAFKLIENEGLNLLVSDVGGLRGRKLFFYTNTGEVLLKRLNDREASQAKEMAKGVSCDR